MSSEAIVISLIVIFAGWSAGTNLCGLARLMYRDYVNSPQYWYKYGE